MSANNGGSTDNGENYYFNCDNERLKHNKDYQSLLQCLGLLEAQKIQAVKDLETLEELKLKVQENPSSFIIQLKDGTITIPTRQAVASLPDVDWTKYGDSLLDSNEMSQSYNTRKKKHLTTNEVSEDIKSSKERTAKNDSFGQSWTSEEQIRLEELLHIYPPEDVESKRWQKIATALGNRTPKQVCCRVQKYFIKLAKAGLPVPGRMPNLAVYSRKTSKTKRTSAKRSSLFFHTMKPRVYMTHEDNINISPESSEDENYNNYWSSISPMESTSEQVIRVCSCCQKNVSLMYWECVECTDDVVLCFNCVNSEWSGSTHLSSHELREVDNKHRDGVNIDKDYSGFNPSITDASYNYLDSNFHPAL